MKCQSSHLWYFSSTQWAFSKLRNGLLETTCMIRIEKAVFMISVSISSENVGGVKFKFCEEIEPYQQPSPVKIKEDPT